MAQAADSAQELPMLGPASGRSLEILLVEDSLVFARITIGALKNGGLAHRLTLVVDGVEAMEFLRREGRFARAPRPDLVLLDLGLPKKDGRAVLAEIKADENLKSIPVVIMTASDSSEDVRICESLGVDAYITKPVDLDKFIELVRKLKKSRSLDFALPGI
jgi:chemotaxis family two-component system response regulator Rcp1